MEKYFCLVTATNNAIAEGYRDWIRKALADGDQDKAYRYLDELAKIMYDETRT